MAMPQGISVVALVTFYIFQILSDFQRLNTSTCHSVPLETRILAMASWIQSWGPMKLSIAFGDAVLPKVPHPHQSDQALRASDPHLS